LGASFPEVLIDEALTPQSCSLCGCQLEKACHSLEAAFFPSEKAASKFWHGWKELHGTPECTGCHQVWSRDINSAQNILELLMCCFRNKQLSRPEHLNLKKGCIL